MPPCTPLYLETSRIRISLSLFLFLPDKPRMSLSALGPKISRSYNWLKFVVTRLRKDSLCLYISLDVVDL
jgi:hypothetical protein